jgi:hypothetical protein
MYDERTSRRTTEASSLVGAGVHGSRRERDAFDRFYRELDATSPALADAVDPMRNLGKRMIGRVYIKTKSHDRIESESVPNTETIK